MILQNGTSEVGSSLFIRYMLLPSVPAALMDSTSHQEQILNLYMQITRMYDTLQASSESVPCTRRRIGTERRLAQRKAVTGTAVRAVATAGATPGAPTVVVRAVATAGAMPGAPTAVVRAVATAGATPGAPTAAAVAVATKAVPAPQK